jgi:hypothetical protein
LKDFTVPTIGNLLASIKDMLYFEPRYIENSSLFHPENIIVLKPRAIDPLNAINLILKIIKKPVVCSV